MREILFRGKDNSGVLNHSWCFGSLDTTLDEQPTIIYPDRFGNRCKIIVKEHTIGQYTGLTDKNGKKIFEGDILKMECDSPHGENKKERVPRIGVVVYDEKHCQFRAKDTRYSQCLKLKRWKGDINEVIGNIHDNPELLKGGAEERASIR